MNKLKQYGESVLWHDIQQKEDIVQSSEESSEISIRKLLGKIPPKMVDIARFTRLYFLKGKT